MAEQRTRPGWLLDEMATIGRENLDEAHVSHYDEKEDADSEAEVQLLQSLGLLTSDSVVVLESGRVTGSGKGGAAALDEVRVAMAQ